MHRQERYARTTTCSGVLLEPAHCSTRRHSSIYGQGCDQLTAPPLLLLLW
jgi:hypothetical protein